LVKFNSKLPENKMTLARDAKLRLGVENE